MKRLLILPILTLCLLLPLCPSCVSSSKVFCKGDPVPGEMTAECIYSGFADAHDTYNAISPASDGKIYYVLSSQRYDIGGQFMGAKTLRLVWPQPKEE